MFRIGEEIELLVDKFADRGKCLSRYDGFIVFIEGIIPGEIVRAKIHKIKKNYAEAKLLFIVKESPFRVTPPCRYFGFCGGCKWQHVLYERQLEAKRQSVLDAAHSIGGFHNSTVNNTIGSSAVYGYRTKMEFSFSDRTWLPYKEAQSHDLPKNTLAAGLHAPFQFSSVIDIKECHLQRSPSSEILNMIRETAITHDWKPWNCFKKIGYLKHLVVRIGERTGEIMVNLVTESYVPERMQALGDLLQQNFPEITTFVNTIVPGSSQNVSGAEVEVLYGQGAIYERIGNYFFEIKPNAFFQPNTSQAEVIYNLSRVYAELKPTDIVYDLYCGTGTISILLSPFARKVVGIEISREAVDNAFSNAKANNAGNCSFICGDLMKVFTEEFVSQHGKPDVIILDPPRPGLHKRTVEHIAQLKASRLVYVSCNPATQMRDIAMLKDFYNINEVQPVDMFPQTYHIESVVKMKLKEDICSQRE
jgi:23S rRNA (uracil1939-C5)-methyltransferase